MLAGASLLGLWCWLTYGGHVRPDFLAAPHEVLLAGWKGLTRGSLLGHIWSSVVVIFSGFLLASVLAVPLGILMGSFKVVEALIEPITGFMRYLPVSAMIPLLILWIGIGIEQKIAVIFIGTFFQQLVLIADVSARVSKDLLDVSYTLGATRRQVVTRVLFPACLPGRHGQSAGHHGLGLDLSGGRRAGRRQFRPRLHDPERHARPVHRHHHPRHRRSSGSWA